MIKSFADKETEKVFRRYFSKRLPPDVQRINKQWRVCFEWRNGHSYQVEITDYH